MAGPSKPPQELHPLKNMILLKTFYGTGGEAGEEPPASPPDLSVSPLSLVFSVPGGRGASEERGRRGHHVHPQLRGPGAAHRQERRPEPAPAAVAELARRWVALGTPGTLGERQGCILRGLRFCKAAAPTGQGIEPLEKKMGGKRAFLALCVHPQARRVPCASQSIWGPQDGMGTDPRHRRVQI